jgi:HK97 gp10 family phage protein
MENVKIDLNFALERVGAFIKSEAIRRCPVDTGELRKTIDFRIEGNKVTLFTTSEIASFVEYGTAPHIIEPKDKKALAFEWTSVGGIMMGKKARIKAGIPKKEANVAVLKKVHHPGTSAQPFMRPAVFENLPQIANIIKENLG